MKSLTLKAPAKINLYLDILGRRKDNYHQIESVIQSISLYDTLHFEKIKREIEIICDHPFISNKENNLIYKAAQLFFNLTNLAPGVKITVQKKIPIGAGLGGGSSDAATTLLGLNLFFKTKIPLFDLMKCSSQIGADVPFCLRKGTALIRGIGNEVYPLPSLEEGWIVLVYPDIHISTAWVYERISRKLTNKNLKTKLNIPDLIKRTKSKKLHAMGDLLYNKLEEVVIKEFPLITTIKEKFRKNGAKNILMSGSGSTLFTLVENAKDANKMADYMRSSGKVYLAQPVNDKVSKEG